MTDQKSAKTYKFKAETKQLLDILAHSLYTNREIFIRELISNAADALDKVRFEEVRGTKIADPDREYEIRIELDADNQTFTITDTGIGMSREELISNIGTIAHSGTAEFLKQLTKDEKQGPELIGQFGVGFYSVFIAAEEVSIRTRSFKEDAVPCEWRSDGTGTYRITELDEAPRGTRIEVKLRDDAKEFTEKHRVENVIKKYSNFVPFPIHINGEQVNKISAIWREPKSSINEEQYVEFFKFIANTSEEPLTHLHISADVPIQFHSLLYIPKTNIEMPGFPPPEVGVNLFVKRILVQQNSKDLLPNYLRFIRGVVDSEDLPLNISRETLQENLALTKIKSVLVKKILTHLSEIAEKDKEKYEQFWNEFGRIFKEGYADYGNQEKIFELFRFNSSHFDNAEALTSLQDYVDRMAEGQEQIYYLSSQNREVMEQNPHLELFHSKGIEVLYLYDPIDEFVMSGIQKFKDKELASADQIDPANLDKIKDKEKKEDQKEEEKIDTKELGDLCARIKNILGDKVKEVRASERLTASPAVLVNPDGTMSAQMEKLMQAINKDAKVPAKIMEVNGKHPLIKNMLEIYKKDPKDVYLDNAAENLYYSVLLLDGYLPDPHRMVGNIQEMLTKSSDLYVDKSQAK
ncbi:molecular chaperone HtpG [candidate division KSB1 bacterium]|nr:molecular chaperone HtpG [candidate division KSB1 bacterium]